MTVCPNPFMLRSNDAYGMSLQEACRRATSMNSKGSTDEGPQKPSQDTSFLYSRESDRIGEGVVSLFDFACLSSNSSGVLTR